MVLIEQEAHRDAKRDVDGVVTGAATVREARGIAARAAEVERRTDRGTRGRIEAGRGAWVQVVDGEIEVNGTMLRSGDGIAVERVSSVGIVAVKNSEFLLFDLK